MRRALGLLLVVACSDSSSRPKPPPIAKPATPDAATADAELVTADSWIGIRLDGLAIFEVLPNTPAKEAGLLAGDQLVALYGEPVESARDFVNQIRTTPNGATIPLVVSRHGKELKLSITVERFPAPR